MRVRKKNPLPLNIRSNGSYEGKVKGLIEDFEPLTIVQQKKGWGRLEQGGWINLEFVEEVDDVRESEDEAEAR